MLILNLGNLRQKTLSKKCENCPKLRFMRLLLGVTAVALMLASGCQDEKIALLEKENQELKASMNKKDAAADLDLQAKCSKDARIWFNENWRQDKDTLYLDFTNHYNKSKGRCFILVEYHYNIEPFNKNQNWSTWMGDESIWDVYENAKYGDFSEQHMSYFKPTFTTKDTVTECVMYGQKCESSDQFNGLARPYMND